MSDVSAGIVPDKFVADFFFFFLQIGTKETYKKNFIYNNNNNRIALGINRSIRCWHRPFVIHNSKRGRVQHDIVQLPRPQHSTLVGLRPILLGLLLSPQFRHIHCRGTRGKGQKRIPIVTLLCPKGRNGHRLCSAPFSDNKMVRLEILDSLVTGLLYC